MKLILYQFFVQISIPSGTIKEEKEKYLHKKQKFQFLVRLKKSYLSNLVGYVISIPSGTIKNSGRKQTKPVRFQFLLVRLKVKLHLTAKYGAYKFQFLLVRLKVRQHFNIV